METLTTREQANVTSNGAQAARASPALIPATPEEAANFTLSDDPATRNAQSVALAAAPLAVRETVLLTTAAAAERLYGEDEALTEFTHALEGDPVFDDCLDSGGAGRPPALNPVL